MQLFICASGDRCVALQPALSILLLEAPSQAVWPWRRRTPRGVKESPNYLLTKEDHIDRDISLAKNDIDIDISLAEKYIVSILGRGEGYTVKYNPLPEGVPEGEAQGNS